MSSKKLNKQEEEVLKKMLELMGKQYINKAYPPLRTNYRGFSLPELKWLAEHKFFVIRVRVSDKIKEWQKQDVNLEAIEIKYGEEFLQEFSFDRTISQRAMVLGNKTPWLQTHNIISHEDIESQ